MTDAGRVSLPWVKAAPYEGGNLFVRNKEFRKTAGKMLNNRTSNGSCYEYRQIRCGKITHNQNTGQQITQSVHTGSQGFISPPLTQPLHIPSSGAGEVYVRYIDFESRYPAVHLCYLRPSKFSLSRRNESSCVM